MRQLALALLLVAGCGGSPDPCLGNSCNARDLAGARDASAAPDLAVADLAPPADLAAPADLVVASDFAGLTFCANTSVASTCAQAFFESVGACFGTPPQNGCTTAGDNMTFDNFCWPNGDQLLATLDAQTMMAHGIWKASGKLCMTGDVMPVKGGGPIFTLTVGNETLVYNETTGAVTCPDGSSTNIGPKEGGCPALVAILEPPTKNCAPGVCQ